MTRELPTAVARNPYVQFDRDENDRPIAAYLDICTACHEAYAGPDNADKCDHPQQERTLVWKREPDTSFLGRRFNDSSANEEGRILTQVSSNTYLVQVREITKHDTLTLAQYLATASLRVVPLSKIKTWQIFTD